MRKRAGPIDQARFAQSAKHAARSLALRAAPRLRAFSGEVEAGSPQKMRPPKDNQSEFQFHRNGTEFALVKKFG
ncbi:MAG: hypothetical protein WAU59_13625, partial [Rhodoplanes sp.]